MADESASPTKSTPQAPAENTPTGSDVLPKTYRLSKSRVIINALLKIGQALVIAVVAGGGLISGLTKEIDIGENTPNVLVSIGARIALLLAILYIWYRIHDYITFSITSDNAGLTLQKDKKIIKIAWNEVASFQNYKIGIQNDVIEIPEELSDRDHLKKVIEQNAAQSITKNLLSRFEQEGKVTLGIIDITDKGLLIKRGTENEELIEAQFIPWKDIAGIDVDEQGIVQVIKPDYKLHPIGPVSDIPNYYALVVFVERLRHRPEDVPTSKLPQPGGIFEQAVFISYAWGGRSEELVDRMDQSLQARGIKIIRDKRDLGFKGSITEFMKRIGEGNCVIVVISDKYLRSPNCMFELVEIAENKQFRDRIFPVVLADAKIYDPVERLEYVKYWETKRAELATAIKSVDPAHLQGIRDDMDNYDRFRDEVSGLTSILKDMNTLTSEMHQESDFKALYESIEKRLRQDNAKRAQTSP